jgi:hypothetical protein
MGVHLYLHTQDRAGNRLHVRTTPWVRVPSTLEGTVFRDYDAALWFCDLLIEGTVPCCALPGVRCMQDLMPEQLEQQRQCCTMCTCRPRRAKDEYGDVPAFRSAVVALGEATFDALEVG